MYAEYFLYIFEYIYVNKFFNKCIIIAYFVLRANLLASCLKLTFHTILMEICYSKPKS